MRYIIAACLLLSPSVGAAQRGYEVTPDSSLFLVTSRSPMTDTLDTVVIGQNSDSTSPGFKFLIAATCFDTAATGRMRSGTLTLSFDVQRAVELLYYFAPDSTRMARSTALNGVTDTGFYVFRFRVPPAPLSVSRGWKGSYRRGAGVREVEGGRDAVRDVFGKVLADTTSSTVLYVQASVGYAAMMTSSMTESIHNTASPYVARFSFDPEKKRMWQTALRQCGLTWRSAVRR